MHLILITHIPQDILHYYRNYAGDVNTM